MNLLSGVSLFDFATNEQLYGWMNPLGEEWFAWNVVLKAMSAKKLDKKEQRFFGKITGGLKYVPGKVPRNMLAIIGRRGGKTLNITRINTYRLLSFDSPSVMKETVYNAILVPKVADGFQMIEYAETLFKKHDALRERVVLHNGKLVNKTQHSAELRLDNDTVLAVIPVGRSAGRGFSIYTLTLDEAAFFKASGRFSDEEMFKSARPAMATFGDKGAYFIITTPYLKEGLVYSLFDQYYGKANDEIFVIRGTSKEFNPTLTDAYLDSELRKWGEEYFKREYQVEFAQGKASAFNSEAVDACVLKDIRELPYSSEYEYWGILDPSGLSPNAERTDEFTAGVVHVQDMDGKRVAVIGKIAGWTSNKESPNRSTQAEAVGESIQLFKKYGVNEIYSDRFAAEFFRPKYEDAGFEFHEAELSKWDLWLELLPSINTKEVRWIDDDIATTQLLALERVSKAGRDRIDKAQGRHDDRANIIALGNYVGREKGAAAGVSFAWV